MSSFFNAVFYHPLVNALVVLTSVAPFHDLGIAVIALTVLTRLILFPFSHRPVQTQYQMKMIEPELQKIRETIPNKEEQAKETMALYKRHGVNPFIGILSLFVQIPVFLALYNVFSKGAAIDPKVLYPFVSLPAAVHTEFLGLIDLTQRSIVLAVLAAGAQFLHMWLTNHFSKSGTKSDFNKALSFQMTYGMPVVVLIVSLSFPAAVSLYWTTSTIFSIVHEGFVRRSIRRNSLYGTRNDQNSGARSSPAA